MICHHQNMSFLSLLAVWCFMYRYLFPWLSVIYLHCCVVKSVDYLHGLSHILSDFCCLSTVSYLFHFYQFFALYHMFNLHCCLSAYHISTIMSVVMLIILACYALWSCFYVVVLEQIWQLYLSLVHCWSNELGDENIYNMRLAWGHLLNWTRLANIWAVWLTPLCCEKPQWIAWYSGASAYTQSMLLTVLHKSALLGVHTI